MKPTAHSLTWFFVFLLGTCFAGLVLRWQMAGVTLSSHIFLDWRRAHSHLGFYGVLFPLTWICLEKTSAWVPRLRTRLFYYALVAIAGLSFLFSGYGFFSIAASTGILAIWLMFAWKNFKLQNFFQPNWESSISVSISLAALLILAVAILTKSQPERAQQLARAFLTLLLFGVFLPTVLRLFSKSPPSPLLWIASTFFSAVFLTKLSTHPAFGLGTLYISWVIVKTIYQMPNSDMRLKLCWIVFAIGFVLSGLSLIPISHQKAIAGIHLLILGPLLMSFVLIHLKLKIPNFWRLFYELNLGAMIFAIAFQESIPFSLSFVTAGTATGVWSVILLGFVAHLRGQL